MEPQMHEAVTAFTASLVTVHVTVMYVKSQ